RKRPCAVGEVAEGTGEVRRLWVMAARRDAFVREVSHEFIASRAPYDVEMPDRRALFRSGGQLEVADAGEGDVVERRSLRAFPVPVIEQGKLAAEHERLERVQSGGIPRPKRAVLLHLAVLTESAREIGNRGVVGDERPCVTDGAEVLRGIEAERRCCPARTCPQAV